MCNCMEPICLYSVLYVSVFALTNARTRASTTFKPFGVTVCMCVCLFDFCSVLFYLLLLSPLISPYIPLRHPSPFPLLPFVFARSCMVALHEMIFPSCPAQPSPNRTIRGAWHSAVTLTVVANPRPPTSTLDPPSTLKPPPPLYPPSPLLLPRPPRNRLLLSRDCKHSGVPRVPLAWPPQNLHPPGR